MRPGCSHFNRLVPCTLDTQIQCTKFAWSIKLLFWGFRFLKYDFYSAVSTYESSKISFRHMFAPLCTPDIDEDTMLDLSEADLNVNRKPWKLVIIPRKSTSSFTLNVLFTFKMADCLYAGMMTQLVKSSYWTFPLTCIGCISTGLNVKLPLWCITNSIELQVMLSAMHASPELTSFAADAPDVFLDIC